MPVKLSVDIRRALATLAYVRTDQVPFAVALALTNTARLARDDVRATISERFTTRGSAGQFIRRGIEFERADKRNLQATVYDRDWFMGYQEAGGTKTPLQAPDLAIPGTAIQAQQFKPKVSVLLQQPATFVSTLADGSLFVGRRVGPEHNPIEVLDLLRPSVEIRPRFGMAATVGSSVERNFAQQFVDAAHRAMQTAR